MFFNKSPLKSTGERQVQKKLNKIRIDHRARYTKSLEYINNNDNILDIACGIGYGSFLIGKEQASTTITAVDISQDAIDYANKYYQLNNIKFICSDAESVELPTENFDKIISFETIEHLKPNVLKNFLNKVHTFLKKDGLFIMSTPNQELLPFDKDIFKFHVRHFTPQEIKDTLNEHNFKINTVFSQISNKSDEIIDGWNGIFNIIIASKI